MEAKEAYQQLLDEKEGRAGRAPGGSAGSTRGGGRAPGAGGSGWGGYQSGSSSSSGGYRQSSSYQGQQRWQPPEPDYSFGECGGSHGTVRNSKQLPHGPCGTSCLAYVHVEPGQFSHPV